MHRRNFLSLIAGFAVSPAAIAKSNARKQCLLLIELQGGNDGLNTVIPFADKAYSALRPTLAIKNDKLWKLDEKTALHPSLHKLNDCWQADQLAIVQGLGYENPNRSHFRSHDIWTSASEFDQRKDSGWLADTLPEENSTVQAVIYGNRSSVLQGGELNYISMHRTREFLSAKLPKLQALESNANNSQRHVHSVLKNTLAYQQRLRAVAKSLEAKDPDDGGEFGNNLFAKQLQDAALLISSGLAPSVITLHLKGFDTHANQIERQGKLLENLSTALAAFRAQLIQNGHWDDTLVVTWSEFGRRAGENASGGTDHGTAAPQFVLGGRVKGGLHGQQPSLSELQNDDLVHTVDFRQLYASLAEQWWTLADSSINKKRYPALDLVKSA